MGYFEVGMAVLMARGQVFRLSGGQVAEVPCIPICLGLGGTFGQ